MGIVDRGANGVGKTTLPLLGHCCLVYSTVIAVLAPADFAWMLLSYGIVLLVGLPFVVAITLGIVGYLDRPANPLAGARQFVGTVRWSTSARIMLVAVLVAAGYNTLKSNIPDLMPFYADPYLADIDEWLHGKPPWQLAHKLPTAIVSPLVDFTYSFVWFGQWLGVLFYVSLWNGGARRERYLWALASTVLIIGTLLATAFSSVGPVFYHRFYGSDRFNELNDALLSNGPALAKLFAAYLVKSHLGDAAAYGTGISAMPSMHMAICVLNASFLTTFGHRSLTLVAWLFVALMQFGMVYSGWHYAVDGYVSIIVVGVIWWVSGRYLLTSHATGKSRVPSLKK